MAVLLPLLSDLDAERLRQRAVRLEYFTVGWMVVEAGVALIAGVLASSIALVGFGLESVIEIVAAVALLWRLTRARSREVHAESRARKVVGLTFFALSGYVAYESVGDLWLKRVPETSLAGIVLGVIALIVMPVLGLAKRCLSVSLNSRALAAESMQTLCCAYFSGTLLIGLVLNRWLGWWWADPAAALVMAAIMVREGHEAYKGQVACCDRVVRT